MERNATVTRDRDRPILAGMARNLFARCCLVKHADPSSMLTGETGEGFTRRLVLVSPGQKSGHGSPANLAG
ncbi:hypothetical protein K227x_03430 [Rubripirellula lacrimiformis]|uniref:Uncharacterized protein n=1 Tax=Rubripirellula lacrimiformis TaxID=1930273 RepID=A0A517N4C3_9BACT|nr:hypothetical protein K227x_03430 [Rubripirellula lacrimiformis]